MTIGYSQRLKDFESSNPDFWKELRSTDPAALIGSLVVYKRKNYPHDGRHIHVCGLVSDALLLGEGS